MLQPVFSEQPVKAINVRLDVRLNWYGIADLGVMGRIAKANGVPQSDMLLWRGAGNRLEKWQKLRRCCSIVLRGRRNPHQAEMEFAHEVFDQHADAIDAIFPVLFVSSRRAFDLRFVGRSAR